MIDGVDSAKNHVGDVFHGSLETDVTVGNTIVARKAPMCMAASPTRRRAELLQAVGVTVGTHAHGD